MPHPSRDDPAGGRATIAKDGRMWTIGAMRAVQVFLLSLVFISATESRAQFLDTFDQPKTDGWFTMVGDGSAVATFAPETPGIARLTADGRGDAHNVWWTLIKRDISAFVDMKKLQDPAYELRVEARVKPSHAPRRMNFMVNTPRTTDYHEQLREYDLDSEGWHTVSMTTRNFDPVAGEPLYVQLAITDWGLGVYHLDVDYYRADVVLRDAAQPDVGEPLIYHPQHKDPSQFSTHLVATHDTVLRDDFPEVNFNDWEVRAQGGTQRVLSVGANQWVVLRWDFTSQRGSGADGPATLELTTQSVLAGGNYVQALGEDFGIEFGKVRVIEILGGDPDWDQKTVTFASLLQGARPSDVFNSQMIFDTEVNPQPNGRTFITLPRPVMQRLLNGKTHGLLIRPLGAITATVFASEAGDGKGPTLHFSTTQERASQK